MILVNMLPEKRRIIIPYMLITEILILSSLLYFTHWFLYEKEIDFGFNTTKQFSKVLSEIKHDIKKLEIAIKREESKRNRELEEIQEKYEMALKEKEMLENLTGFGLLPWTSIFEEFTGIINSNDVWIKSFNSSRNQVNLTGTSLNDMKSVSKFMSDLENSTKGVFYDVVLISTSKSKKHNKVIYEFSLNFKINRKVDLDDYTY